MRNTGLREKYGLVQAAIDGQGLILADQLMAAELTSGSLIAPFSERLEGYGYIIMSAPARKLGAQALLLRDWLRSTVD